MTFNALSFVNIDQKYDYIKFKMIKDKISFVVDKIN